MPDNELDIYIRMITQQTGEKPEEVLKKLKEQVKDTGKEAVKAEEEITEATNKTFASKRELKGMLKQLQHEFPLLGQIGRLALNPVALASAGIVAAFQLWKYRVDELTRSLGGIERADVTEGMVERAERMAAACGKWAEKVNELGEKAVPALERFKEISDFIDTSAAIQKALGIETGAGPTQAKGDWASQLAAETLAIGTAKVKAGGNISDKDLERLKLQAEASEKILLAQKERMDFLSELRNVTPGEAAGQPSWRRMKYYLRYGSIGYDDATALEQKTSDQAQADIGRYQTALERRGLRSAGLADIGNAAGLSDAAVGLRGQAAAQQSQASSEAMGALNSSSWLTLPQNLIRFIQASTEANKSIEQYLRELENRDRVRAQRQ